jgi:Fe-S-cluster-containing dehydrogenase component
MIACKAKTNSFLGSHYIETYTSTSGTLERPNIYFLPATCQHCANPSCVPVCAQGVLAKRDDGIVTVGDAALCKDCVEKPCVAACPYKAIELDPLDGRIGKCDLCADLVDAGQVPACAEGCMARSIFFGDFDDPESVVSQILAEWEPTGYVHQLLPESGNEPTMRYLLSRVQWINGENLRSPAWHNPR